MEKLFWGVVVALDIPVTIVSVSGPCGAGLVYYSLPRYLLFGDTVEIALALEHAGEGKQTNL